MKEVRIRPAPMDRFAELYPEERYRELVEAFDEASRRYEGRTLWNVNPTAAGGAEMLTSLLAYAGAGGITARLHDPDWAAEMGERAQKRATTNLTHLTQTP